MTGTNMGGEGGEKRGYDRWEGEVEGYKPPPMDRDAQRAAMEQAADSGGGLAPGELLTAIPSGEPGPPGWTRSGTVTPSGHKQSFDIYRTLPQSDPTLPPGEPGGGLPAGTEAGQDIEDKFSEGRSPDGICETCIVRGFARGFAIGFAIAFLVSLLSGALLAVVVTALAVLMVKGLLDLAANWDKMTPAEKQEAVAEIVGGVVGGGLGAKFGPKLGPKLRGKGAPAGKSPIETGEGIGRSVKAQPKGKTSAICKQVEELPLSQQGKADALEAASKEAFGQTGGQATTANGDTVVLPREVGTQRPVVGVEPDGRVFSGKADVGFDPASGKMTASNVIKNPPQ